jgi:hypothetical protein
VCFSQGCRKFHRKVRGKYGVMSGGGGETRNFERNLPHCHFIHMNPTFIRREINPGLPGENPAFSRLNCGSVYLGFTFDVETT